MIRRPPRSTLKLCRRQRQMCIRDSPNIMDARYQFLSVPFSLL
nr:hypothetical protein [Pedobacter sp. ASV2]